MPILISILAIDTTGRVNSVGEGRKFGPLLNQVAPYDGCIDTTAGLTGVGCIFD